MTHGPRDFPQAGVDGEFESEDDEYCVVPRRRFVTSTHYLFSCGVPFNWDNSTPRSTTEVPLLFLQRSVMPEPGVFFPPSRLICALKIKPRGAAAGELLRKTMVVPVRGALYEAISNGPRLTHVKCIPSEREK